MISEIPKFSFETIFKGLNLKQQEAVLHNGGPAVVFAGAGSGKTRVIAVRIARLIEEGVKPQRILAVTFTNKASKEMRERVNNLTPAAPMVHIGTFHSCCARWLREFAVELGFTADYTIYDDKDALQTIKKILKELKIEDSSYPPQIYNGAIQKAKTAGFLPSDLLSQSLGIDFPPLGIEVYRRYQAVLANCNAMDFGDLMMNMLILLKKNESARLQMQTRYDHVLIDEFQDTNATQFSLVSYLIAQSNNLFVVGDDDQSIYSWRGANPANIINFGKIFQGCNEIRLEQNYRCAGNIVKAASSVIQNNNTRASKVLWTAKEDGEKIDFFLETDGETEAFSVCDTIIREQKIYPFKDVAVFYRTNNQSRQMEEVLIKENLPYKIYGSLRFYDRLEIKDLIAYLKLLVNPHDDIALKRIINVPTRGIGATSMEQLENLAFQNQVSLFEYIWHLLKTDAEPKLRQKLEKFVKILDELQKTCKEQSLSHLFIKLLDLIDYKTYVRKKFPEQVEDKLANIQELGTALSEYQAHSENPSLSNWLKEITLDSNTSGVEEAAGINLMTLHSAKGLEFKRVFIIGVEDGLLPHQNSINATNDQIEEERRLFYVGLTRAIEKISLYSARKRRFFNNFVAYDPSRFLKEIPSDIFSFHSAKITEDAKNFSVGQLVLHPTYGKGRLEALEVSLGVSKGVVNFTDFGKRRIPLGQLSEVKARYDFKNFLKGS